MSDDNKLRLALVDTFVAPHPQPDLDGDLGLTNYEIARSLGVEVRAVNEKLARGKFAEMCKALRSKMIVNTISNDSGRSVTVYTMDTRAAQAVVAKWDNERGWGYLAYLLDADKALHKMAAEISRLRADVAALTAPKPRSLPGKGIVTFIKKLVRETDMFGETSTRVVTERKSVAALTEDERRAYSVQHRARTIRGLSEAQDADINYTGLPRLPN